MGRAGYAASGTACLSVRCADQGRGVGLRGLDSKFPFYQRNAPLNLGGVDAAGKPKIPLTMDGDSRFTFKVPADALPGEWYVEAVNPPFLPFSSSYTDPGGAFVLH